MRRRGLRRMLALTMALLLMLGSIGGLAEALSKGSKGDEVVQLQNQLNRLGYSVGTADGDFGGKTEKALIRFQEDHGLEQTGALDDATRNAIAGELLDSETRRYEYYRGNYTWKEANARAIAMGGHLVNINSMEELEELESELLEVGGAGVTFWIGARRDPNAASASTGFWWVDGQNRTLPDMVELFGDYNPWALGQPNYVADDGARENYVQLRYSAGEARWVLEDALGTVDEGVQYGYIVEYEDRRGRAVLEPSEVALLKPLSFGDEPEYQPPKASDKPYKVFALSMIGRNLYVKVNATQDPDMYCYIQMNFWRYDHGAYRDENRIYDDYKHVYGELRGDWIRFEIPEENYEQFVAEPEGVLLETWLYCWDEAKDKPVRRSDYYEEMLPLVGPEADPASDSNREYAGGLYRVTPCLASDPVAGDEGRAVAICDTDGRVEEVKVGTSAYLAAGEYTARLEDDGTVETAFTVGDGAHRVILNDCGSVTLEGRVANRETGEAGAGLEVAVENQGRTYKATTDSEGKYRIEGMAPVESLAYVFGMGVDTDYAGEALSLSEEKIAKWAEITYLPATAAAFIGRVHYGGEEWYEEFYAWADRPHTIVDEVPWFIGRSLYVVAEKDAFSEYYKSFKGDTVEPGTILNVGNNIPAEKIVKYPSLDRMKDEAPFETDESTGISEPVTVFGNIEQERIREVNPTYDGFFEGWSDYVIDTDSQGALICTPETAYHHLLLKAIDAGKNPMEDPIFRALLCRSYDMAGFTQSQIETILRVLDNAPGKYREMYLLSLNNYKMEGNSKRRKDDNGKDLPAAFFRRPTKEENSLSRTMLISDRIDPKEFEATFFHESGHAIELSDVNVDAEESDFDNHLVFPQIEGKIQEALKEAVVKRISEYLDRFEYTKGNMWYSKTESLTEAEKERIIEAFVNGRSYINETDKNRFWWNQQDYRTDPDIADDPKLGIAYDVVRQELRKELTGIDATNRRMGTRDASMASDIFGAVTNDKIFGDYGHASDEQDKKGNWVPTYYWYDENGKATDRRLAEAWAEYFSAVIRNDTESMRTNYEYFGPDVPSESYAIPYMEQLATEIHDYYYRKCSQEYADKPVQ